jgi:hypothetical protein
VAAKKLARATKNDGKIGMANGRVRGNLVTDGSRANCTTDDPERCSGQHLSEVRVIFISSCPLLYCLLALACNWFNFFSTFICSL